MQKKRAENDASQELRRRDKALLNTYSSEKEIDLKRAVIAAARRTR